MSESGNSTFTNMLCILVFLTNLSQMPIFVDEGITQYISMPLWIILLGYYILNNRYPILSAFKTVVNLTIVFGIFYLIMSALDPEYLRSALPSVLLISVFVLLCTSCIGAYVTDKDLSKIFTYYVISVVIVGLSVYERYIAQASLVSRTYLYDSKNSISQILLTAWLIILFTKFSGLKWTKYLYGVIFIFLTYEIIMLQSRATIIGIPIALIIAIIKGNISKGTKTAAIIFCVGVIFLLMQGNTLDYFIEKVIYAGRNSNDINDLSSGRSSEWGAFFTEFSESPLFGVGKCKRESIILTSLLEFGLVGGVPLLIIAFSPLFFILKYSKYISRTNEFPIFLIIVITYCLNGVFEQLAPLGPGAKCYFLWFLYGIIGMRLYYNRNKGHRSRSEKYFKL